MRPFIIFAALLLAGCAKQYGNFIEPEKNEVWLNKALASEFSQLLQRQQPPAWTKVNFRHETEDLFGQALVKDLRQDRKSVV